MAAVAGPTQEATGTLASVPSELPEMIRQIVLANTHASSPESKLSIHDDTAEVSVSVRGQAQEG
jgi:hypothetical protein